MNKQEFKNTLTNSIKENNNAFKEYAKLYFKASGEVIQDDNWNHKEPLEEESKDSITKSEKDRNFKLAKEAILNIKEHLENLKILEGLSDEDSIQMFEAIIFDDSKKFEEKS